MIIKTKKETIITDNVCYNGNGWFEFTDCKVIKGRKSVVYRKYVVYNKDIVETKEENEDEREKKKHKK